MTSSLSAKVDSRPSGVIPTFRDKRDHEFYEYILNDIPDLDLELFNLINSLGIENTEQWEDAYVQSMSSRWSSERHCEYVEAQFTEQLMDDLGYLSESNLPNFISNHIDWQEVWDCELCHDYCTIEYDGVTHFFSRHF